jgi:hypothetical protein
LKDAFLRQAGLILRILPLIHQEQVFALKGGTAINFFVRDLPRLSVDIDLVYLPVTERTEALAEINQKLHGIAEKIRRMFPTAVIQESGLKLILRLGEATVKIEPNQVLRGSVHAAEVKELVPEAQKVFEVSVDMSTLSAPDLYGGKICAALDRQHPRDLFDIKLLLDHEGLTEGIRKAFVVYLIGHNRPMSELLDPRFSDMRHVFENEFVGTMRIPCEYEDLVETRARLVKLIRSSLTGEEKEFIASIQEGNPHWDLLGLSDIGRLPAVRWKLLNVAKMSSSKKKQEVEKLRAYLET